MYIGNLEPYQGIDLLLNAFKLAHVQFRSNELSLVVVGGRADDIEKYQTMTDDTLGLAGAVHFLGPREAASQAWAAP